MNPVQYIPGNSQSLLVASYVAMWYHFKELSSIDHLTARCAALVHLNLLVNHRECQHVIALIIPLIIPKHIACQSDFECSRQTDLLIIDTQIWHYGMFANYRYCHLSLWEYHRYWQNNKKKWDRIGTGRKNLHSLGKADQTSYHDKVNSWFSNSPQHVFNHDLYGKLTMWVKLKELAPRPLPFPSPYLRNSPAGQPKFLRSSFPYLVTFPDH